jgi:L-amino acid N-acyltransferase YncA
MDKNTDSFLIRRAVSEDAKQIIEGINDICSRGGAFYTTHYVPTSQWEAVLYHSETVPDHLLAVAEWNRRIIGAGRVFPGGNQTLMNHVAELGLFVLNPFRRQGIGSQLLNWLMNWARQGNIKKVTLTVFATNSPAIRLFEKHGFTQVGCLHNQVMVKDSYTDLLLMEQFLHTT